jgi:hypothetical protein
VVIGLAAAASSVHAKAPLPLKPVLALRPERGFFDEALALDADGKRLALVRTDDSSFLRLEIYDLPAGTQVSSAVLGDGHGELGLGGKVDAVHLLPPGQGAVLVVSVLGEDGPRAVHVDAAGKVDGHTPPATAFAMAGFNEGDKPTMLIGVDKKVALADGLPGDVTYTIAAYRVDGLAPIGRPRLYQIGADGQLVAPAVKVLGFFDGYTKLLGERAGGHDRKTDVQRPARRAVLDTLTGKVVDEGEIADAAGWALTAKLRAAHPDRTVFVEVTDDQGGIELVDADGKRTPLATAVPFRLYDPAVIQQQEGEPGGRAPFYFSLAIDPANAAAIARKKADVPYLDLYAVDVAAGTCALRARILLSRPVVWRIARGRLAVLKKVRGTSRGGDELDVYDLR